MKILLLGGTGAIGNNVAKILDDGSNELFITSRQDRKSTNTTKYLKVNARNIEELNPILEQNYWDAIIDFMVYGSNDFASRVDKYLASTKHYLFFSSARVYAESKTPITEDSLRLLDSNVDCEYLQTDEYALSKAREENILLNHKLKNWTIIRPYITFDTYRLQLGVYEKEQWLYRALDKRPIVFDKYVYEKYTTLTSGYDVALAVAEIAKNDKTCGNTYHITTDKSVRWKDILEVYLNTIEKVKGFRPKVKLVDTLKANLLLNQAQYKYDRMYDRFFSNESINKVIKIEYHDTLVELERRLFEFLGNPKFLNINIRLEAKMDRCSKNFSILKIKGLKNKIKYLIRYFS